MTRDETIFSDPERFLPERFMSYGVDGTKGEEQAIDPRGIVFGFGRRYAKSDSYSASNGIVLRHLHNSVAYARGDSSPILVSGSRLLPSQRLLTSVKLQDLTVQLLYLYPRFLLGPSGRCAPCVFL